ncbi:hypothetical protein ZIOFF_002427 [Zingiber officinale]|uniref:Protein FAR1-RELATED SEQUENCE n=1 Tax=Zingiber officinale TaxID=94328 RepID=A0A8J5I6V5_ZINOF|nr:hypothetical protein ZIOFF_002427 [Zingiber officinale]
MDGSLVNTKTMDSSVGSTKTMDRSLEGSVASDVSGEGTNGINRLTKRISASVENEICLDGAMEITNAVDGSRQNVVDRDTTGRSTIDGCVKNTGNVDILVKKVPETTEYLELEPKVGMVFHSEEEAFNFYNSYAKRKGFSVRKGHLSRRRDNSIRDRHYVCSNEGTRQDHRTHVTKKPRPLERTQCLARIEFKVNRSNAWVINKFVEEHNHPLASPNKIHMLRSHRKKLPIERTIFTEADYYYGVRPSQMHDNYSEALHGNELHMKNQSCLITESFPDVCHRFCLWHILQNVPKSHSMSNRELNFQKDFEDCIFGGGFEEVFCKLWDILITKHGHGSCPWLKDLYLIREKWALPYLSNSFCATMMTKQWVESMDNLFKVHFYRKLPLPKFIAQYFKTLTQLREKELIEDYESRQTKPVLLVDIPVLAEAAESYTRSIYMDFEYEYKSQLACLCEPVAMDGTVYTFRVSVPQRCTGIVEFNPSNLAIKCSCKKFESMGVLCMHTLKVLNNNNILYLPPQYILKRWTKYAKDGIVHSGPSLVADSSAQESLTLKYSRICHKAVSVAVKSAPSKDALEILEHGLDRFIAEMENMFHGAPWTKQSQNMNVVDDVQQNTLETSGICFDSFEFSAR